VLDPASSLCPTCAYMWEVCESTQRGKVKHCNNTQISARGQLQVRGPGVDVPVDKR
jgi:hypothetical protein